MYVCGFTHACEWIKLFSCWLFYMRVFYRKPMCFCRYLYKTMKPRGGASQTSGMPWPPQGTSRRARWLFQAPQRRSCRRKCWTLTCVAPLTFSVNGAMPAELFLWTNLWCSYRYFVNLFFLFSPMLAPVLHRNVLSEQHSVSTHWFPAVTVFFLLFLHPSFHIHLWLILCQGCFRHSWSLFPLLWKFQGRAWLWSDHLSTCWIPVRWLRGMMFQRSEDGDRYRSRSERQRLMFSHAASEFLPNAAFSGLLAGAHRATLRHAAHSLPFRFLDSVKTNTATLAGNVWFWSSEPLLVAPMTPSFRKWVPTSRRWGNSLVCVVNWEFWGAAEFKPFSFTAVENSIVRVHGAWYYCF